MATLPSGGAETVVEAGDRRSRRLRSQENGAVGQLEVRPRPEQGQAQWSIIGQGDRVDLELLEDRGGTVHAASPGRPHEHLGQGEWAGTEFLTGEIAKKVLSPIVVRVSGLEVRDEDAGVEDDHAGQSRRSSSK